MNKILILAKNQQTYFIKRLIDEVGEGRLVFFDPFSEALPHEDGSSLALVRTTGVYQSNKDLDFLKSFTGRVINPLEALSIGRGKSSQYQFCEKHQLPVLPWLKVQDSDLASIMAWASSYNEILIKPDMGQGGWGITFKQVHDLNSWYDQQRQANDLSWILQPYERDATELRAFFIKDEIYCLKRQARKGGVAANFQQGGKAFKANLSKTTERIVRKLMAESSAYYGSIDLLELAMGPMILDFNTVPGIEQIEEIYQINMVKKLLQNL
jgi:glutathione synthase/RimK-type ligase-like ATP-grasp enzyme